MAIRINLLAEAQSAEELRRRDPVKRAAWVGVLAVAAVLAWASLLQARIALRKAEVSRLEGKIAELDATYSKTVETQKSLTQARQKLTALQEFSDSRYLSGNLLDALQHAYVPDVRIVKLKTQFDYTLAAGKPAQTNGVTVTPATPPTSTEAILVQIEAVDASKNPGDQVSKYKEAVAALSHMDAMFKDAENDVRLTGLNPPSTDQNGNEFVSFTLECAYPETIR